MENSYFIHDDIAWIEMNHPKEKRSVFTIIDAANLGIMPKGRICLSGNGYTHYRDGKTNQLLHRLIMGFPEFKIDHKNGDKYDNCRCNLREATKEQNGYNQKHQIGRSSKYKGVCWHKAGGKWMAYIVVNGENKYLGLFTDEIEAAKAYDQKAIEHFGEFARLNFSKEKTNVI